MIWLVLISSALATEVVTWTFEDNQEGFTSEGLQWEWGTFKGDATTDAVGAGGWATRLEGHYLNDASGSLHSGVYPDSRLGLSLSCFGIECLLPVCGDYRI